MSYPLIPAPPGALLVRSGSRRPLLALALRDGDTPMPITSLTCWVCDHKVTDLTAGTLGPRVNGDGRYGYEAMHTACALVAAH